MHNSPLIDPLDSPKFAPVPPHRDLAGHYFLDDQQTPQSVLRVLGEEDGGGVLGEAFKGLRETREETGPDSCCFHYALETDVDGDGMHGEFPGGFTDAYARLVQKEQDAGTVSIPELQYVRNPGTGETIKVGDQVEVNVKAIARAELQAEQPKELHREIGENEESYSLRVEEIIREKFPQAETWVQAEVMGIEPCKGVVQSSNTLQLGFIFLVKLPTGQTYRCSLDGALGTPENPVGEMHPLSRR